MTPEKILVVDDELDLQVLLRQRFRKKIRAQEYEFFFANNGQQALDFLQNQTQNISLILTDLNMPAMDGLTLLSKLPEIDPTLKAVVISAYGDLQNIRAAMNLGAFDFITKPINIQDLEITIDKTLNFVKFLRENQRKLHQTQIQLIQAKEAAETANRAKSIFLGKMSHELRTPLNVILGFTQLIAQDTYLDVKNRENLEIITRNGRYLLTLINDILEMSKIESGQIKVVTNSFDLDRLLQELQKIFQPLATSKGLLLTLERDPNLPQYLKTDSQKLRHILIHLLDNAIKFTHSGKISLQIQFSTPPPLTSQEPPLPTSDNGPSLPGLSLEPFFVSFRVTDTGPGIVPHELDTLFEAFTQKETSQNTQPGIGLGLPISRKFVQLMGGDLQVESVIHQGTTFWFEIPLEHGTPSEIPVQPPQRRVMGLVPGQPIYRLLIVDDRWENRKLLTELLRPLGFEVQEATNGLEAIQRWQQWEPHLIWMDLRMPIMNGYEATQKIRSSLKGEATIIIALTTYTSDDDQNLALSIGCNDYIRKPIQEAVLFEKMAKYLGVSYLYAEPTLSNQPSLESFEGSSTLQSVSQALSQLVVKMKTLPPEWLIQLRQAALGLDDETIFRLLKNLPSSHGALVQPITDLINNFQYDTLMQLTESALSSN